jgi:hypothetical protein
VVDLPSFKELLLAAPDLEALEISRSRDPAHVADLARTGVRLLNPFEAPG